MSRFEEYLVRKTERISGGGRAHVSLRLPIPARGGAALPEYDPEYSPSRLLCRSEELDTRISELYFQLAYRLVRGLGSGDGLSLDYCITLERGGFLSILWRRAVYDARELLSLGFYCDVWDMDSGVIAGSERFLYPSTRRRIRMSRDGGDFFLFDGGVAVLERASALDGATERCRGRERDAREDDNVACDAGAFCRTVQDAGGSHHIARELGAAVRCEIPASELRADVRGLFSRAED